MGLDSYHTAGPVTLSAIACGSGLVHSGIASTTVVAHASRLIESSIATATGIPHGTGLINPGSCTPRVCAADPPTPLFPMRGRVG